MESIEWFCLP